MSKPKLRTVLLLGLALVAGCEDNPAGPSPTPESFGASLTGAAERPNPVTTSTTGTATITFTNDTTITYSITLQNATGITAAHIHIGGTEVAGGILAGLFAAPQNAPVNVSSGVLVEGRITAGTMPANALGLGFESLKGLIRGGGAYVNVHSTSNPAGLVRGQLTPRQ